MSTPLPNFLLLAPVHGKPAILKDTTISTQVIEPSTPPKVDMNDKTKFLILTPEPKSAESKSSTTASPIEYANSSLPSVSGSSHHALDEDDNINYSDQANPAMSTDEETSSYSNEEISNTDFDSDDSITGNSILSKRNNEKQSSKTMEKRAGVEKKGEDNVFDPVQSGSYVPDGVLKGVMQV
jgi:hypothetical protein